MSILFTDLAKPSMRDILNLQVRDVLDTILETGSILGRDEEGRTILELRLDDLQLDELAAFGAELEDLENEPSEDDDGT